MSQHFASTGPFGRTCCWRASLFAHAICKVCSYCILFRLCVYSGVLHSCLAIACCDIVSLADQDYGAVSRQCRDMNLHLQQVNNGAS